MANKQIIFNIPTLFKTKLFHFFVFLIFNFLPALPKKCFFTFQCFPFSRIPKNNFYKIIFLIFSFSLFHFFTFSPALHSASLVSDTWASVQKYIAVHPGTVQSVWADPTNPYYTERALTTNGAMGMTPIGDGTYECTMGLNAGAEYNFMFFARTGSTAPAGLEPNYTYYDCVPTGGNIACGTAPAIVVHFDSTVAGYAHYTSIQWVNNGQISFDARRYLKVPDSLPADSHLYIYNNFSDKPAVVNNFNATPIDSTTVILSWSTPGTSWGASGSFIAADVVAGGYYKIYRNTTGSTTAYTTLATIPGNIYNYTDSNLTPNQIYYYTIVAFDAYQGAGDSFACLSSDTASQDSAIPKTPVRIRFKVERNNKKYNIEGFNWQYVEKNQKIVYMTPEDCENPYFVDRIKGVITRVKLPN